MNSPEWTRSNTSLGSPSPHATQPPQGTEEPGGTSRGPRNQKACDGCRARKVKCFSSPGQKRCQGCVFLDINCTHDRPRRKRGPPNRTQIRAAATLAQVPAISPPSDGTLGSHGSPHSQRHLSFSSAPQPSQVLSPSLPSRLLLDTFAPRTTLTRILETWFNEVHALAPVLIRRQFLRRVAAGEADTNPTFCGLVVSVCAATVATLRRESHGDITIETCRDFIQENNLLRLGLSSDQFSVDWCIGMYNIMTAMMALPHSNLNDMSIFHAWNQAVAGVRYLTYYCMSELSRMEQEQLKRLFWLLFVASASSDCQGKLAPGFITHQESPQLLQPDILTDEELDTGNSTSKEIPDIASSPGFGGSTPWHGDNICYVPGLDSLRKLYLVWHESQTVPSTLLGGLDSALKHYQDRIQQVVDSLPRELRWRGGLSRPPYVTQGHESQTVNLFITSLHLRSNLLQKRAEHNFANACEHQRIIDDLLEILYHLPPPVFYANGLSLMPKIRDIGAAYLEEMETNAERAPDVLDRMERLSRKLSDLDCWPEVPQITALMGGS